MSGLGFALERPWWLLALIPALLAVVLSRGQGGGLAAWRRAVDAPILGAMEALGRVVPGQASRAWAPALIAGLLALALAGPSVRGDEAPAFRNLDGLVVLLDLSPSVSETAALDRARTAARRIVAARGTRPVAVVAFAGDAYLALPFTTDEALISQAIAALGPRVIPDPGTRPGRAADLAAKAVAETGMLRADLVLVSDGGGIDDAALTAVERLQGKPFTLSTVRIAEGEPLDPAAPQAMADMADAGGGTAVRAETIDPLLDRLALSAARSDEALAALGRRDLGPWLIAFALVPALFLFRRTA